MHKNPSFKNTTAAILLLMALSFSFSAIAENKRKGPHHRKPPAEAFTACEGQVEAGASCSFNTAEGDYIEGTCKTPKRSDDGLVCAPERSQKQRRKRDDSRQ